jgi:hypothetical protein
LAGRSKSVNREAPKDVPRVERIAGGLGVPSCSDLGEGDVGIEVWTSDDRAFRGHRERHAKKEWSAKARNHYGSPRRSRTAKASRISRHAVKSRCAHEWGGWGRLSFDGPGHYNPDPSEGPWGGGVITLQGRAQSSQRPDTVRDNRSDHEAHEGRTQTGCRTAYAGSRLKPSSEGRP